MEEEISTTFPAQGSIPNPSPFHESVLNDFATPYRKRSTKGAAQLSIAKNKDNLRAKKLLKATTYNRKHAIKTTELDIPSFIEDDSMLNTFSSTYASGSLFGSSSKHLSASSDFVRTSLMQSTLKSTATTVDSFAPLSCTLSTAFPIRQRDRRNRFLDMENPDDLEQMSNADFQSLLESCCDDILDKKSYIETLSGVANCAKSLSSVDEIIKLTCRALNAERVELSTKIFLSRKDIDNADLSTLLGCIALQICKKNKQDHFHCGCPAEIKEIKETIPESVYLFHRADLRVMQSFMAIPVYNKIGEFAVLMAFNKMRKNRYLKKHHEDKPVVFDHNDINTGLILSNAIASMASPLRTTSFCQSNVDMRKLDTRLHLQNKFNHRNALWSIMDEDEYITAFNDKLKKSVGADTCHIVLFQDNNCDVLYATVKASSTAGGSFGKSESKRSSGGRRKAAFFKRSGAVLDMHSSDAMYKTMLPHFRILQLYSDRFNLRQCGALDWEVNSLLGNKNAKWILSGPIKRADSSRDTQKSGEENSFNKNIGYIWLTRHGFRPKFTLKEVEHIQILATTIPGTLQRCKEYAERCTNLDIMEEKLRARILQEIEIKNTNLKVIEAAKQFTSISFAVELYYRIEDIMKEVISISSCDIMVFDDRTDQLCVFDQDQMGHYGKRNVRRRSSMSTVNPETWIYNEITNNGKYTQEDDGKGVRRPSQIETSSPGESGQRFPITLSIRELLDDRKFFRRIPLNPGFAGHVFTQVKTSRTDETENLYATSTTRPHENPKFFPKEKLDLSETPEELCVNHEQSACVVLRLDDGTVIGVLQVNRDEQLGKYPFNQLDLYALQTISFVVSNEILRCHGLDSTRGKISKFLKERETLKVELANILNKTTERLHTSISTKLVRSGKFQPYYLWTEAMMQHVHILTNSDYHALYLVERESEKSIFRKLYIHDNVEKLEANQRLSGDEKDEEKQSSLYQEYDNTFKTTLMNGIDLDSTPTQGGQVFTYKQKGDLFKVFSTTENGNFHIVSPCRSLSGKVIGILHFVKTPKDDTINGIVTQQTQAAFGKADSQNLGYSTNDVDITDSVSAIIAIDMENWLNFSKLERHIQQSHIIISGIENLIAGADKARAMKYYMGEILQISQCECVIFLTFNEKEELFTVQYLVNRKDIKTSVSHLSSFDDEYEAALRMAEGESGEEEVGAESDGDNDILEFDDDPDFVFTELDEDIRIDANESRFMWRLCQMKEVICATLEEGKDPKLNAQIDDFIGVRTRNALAAPVKNNDDQFLGALLLLNKVSDDVTKMNEENMDNGAMFEFDSIDKKGMDSHCSTLAFFVDYFRSDDAIVALEGQIERTEADLFVRKEKHTILQNQNETTQKLLQERYSHSEKLKRRNTGGFKRRGRRRSLKRRGLTMVAPRRSGSNLVSKAEKQKQALARNETR
eukprot:g4153.t1